jgi:hypothetical protein
MRADSKEWQEANKAFTEANAQIEKGNPYLGVPDAPFKKTWHELALKRMLREASEKGYDRLSWTPGEAQAERYSLAKQVENIQVKPENNTRKVTVNSKSGVHASADVDSKGIITKGYDAFSGSVGKPLSDAIGKEMADRIMKTTADTKLEGEGLKIGGEGMKGFYDNIIPKGA